MMTAGLAEMMSLVFPEQSLSPNHYIIPPYLDDVNTMLHYLKTGTLDNTQVCAGLVHARLRVGNHPRTVFLIHSSTV